MIRYELVGIAEKLKDQYNKKLVVDNQHNSTKGFPIWEQVYYIAEETAGYKKLLGIFSVPEIKKNFLLGIKELNEDDKKMIVYLLDNKVEGVVKENIPNLTERCGMKELDIQKGL